MDFVRQSITWIKADSSLELLDADFIFIYSK